MLNKFNYYKIDFILNNTKIYNIFNTKKYIIMSNIPTATAIPMDDRNGQFRQYLLTLI